MGTKVALAYANLFMGRLEELLINQAPQHIHTWKRFIDDVPSYGLGQLNV